MKPRLLATFLLAALAVPALAQEPAKPGPEHQKLAATAGTWTAALETMGQDGKPMTVKGTQVTKVACGGLWLVEDFTVPDFMGAPFHGHGTTGYDTAKGKYVGTWIDSMSTSVMVTEGSYDKSGKVLTMTGTGPGMDGKPVLMRMVTTEKDANTRVFEMLMPGPDGKEMKTMTITYTRADAKTDKK
ncbi:MAG: DUF1579 domain-containing protein [Planctomycetes bacterium]|nr:DUF1579 domain-containing protein [Planctomycetota bacterium]